MPDRGSSLGSHLLSLSLSLSLCVCVNAGAAVIFSFCIRPSLLLWACYLAVTQSINPPL